MKPLLVVSCSLLLWAAQQQTPVFRGGITIVPLTVAVLDRNGKPVTDLTQDDFTILEDGKKQQVKTFFAETLKPQEPVAEIGSPMAPGAPFENAKPATRRAFVLVLGYGRVQLPVKAADGAIEFIRERLLPQDLVSVVAFNRATNLLTNHALVAETVERFRESHSGIILAIDEFYAKCYNVGQPIPAAIQKQIDDIFAPDALRTAGMRPLGGLLEGSEEYRKDRALAVAKAGALSPYEKPLDARIAVQDLLKVYAGIESLRYIEADKHLVWFSEKGLAAKATNPDCDPRKPLPPAFAIAGGPPVDLAGQVWGKQEDEKLARRAGDAGVTTDIIHTWGVDPAMTPMTLRGGGRPAPAFTSTDHIQSSEYIAELTGGQFAGNEYASQVLHRIDDATRFSYLLGYTPSNPNLDDGFRKVEVKVNRPGLTVLYKHGYTATAETRPLDLRQLLTTSRLNAAAGGDEDSQDIKLQAKASVVSGLGSSRRVVVDLTIDVTRLAWAQDGDRHVATLDVKAFSSDGSAIIGDLDDSLELNFSETEYQRISKSGFRTTVRVPITGDPKYVKVLVYDYRTDLLGTIAVKLK